jgi:ParB family chromosome partitioning protein
MKKKLMSSPTLLNRIRINPNDSKDSLKVIDIPLDLIKSDPNQPRKYFDESALEELAGSIESHGLLQPITVRRDSRKKGSFIIVAGERRYRAFQLLKRELIPAVVSANNHDELALIENLQREDLSAFEEAEGLANLKKKYGYTLKAIGQAVGKAESTISNLLKINELPNKIKKEISTSKGSSRSILMELVRVPDKKDQLKMWETIKTTGMTVKDIRRKKLSKEEQEGIESQRVITSAKRLITRLETLVESQGALEDEGYEELLNVYERFVQLMEKTAMKREG